MVIDPVKLVRPPSASTVSTAEPAIAKTPLGRIEQALELGRRGRSLARMAKHGRQDAAGRAR